jgi:predicted nucleic acid-binding protein
LATTSINVAEFLRGIPPGPEQGAAHRFLGAFAEAPFGPRAAHRYGLFMQSLDRMGTRIEETDGLIAAVVLEEGGRLLTRNTRHFRRVPGLELVPLPS